MVLIQVIFHSLILFVLFVLFCFVVFFHVLFSFVRSLFYLGFDILFSCLFVIIKVICRCAIVKLSVYL